MEKTLLENDHREDHTMELGIFVLQTIQDKDIRSTRGPNRATL